MARARANIDKIPAGPELNALVAERVMGWKELKRQSDRYWGRKKDKAGRWRRAAVHDYCHEPTTSYLIEERMKELGLFDRYEKELAKLARAQKLPPSWASPDQRCRAAVKTMQHRRI
ncbi:MAG TPA: hypothetical protein VHM64_25620 [Candidatus Binatia bacterium]|nr:hypothetical protein [Candidatus Binatia bacterium]